MLYAECVCVNVLNGDECATTDDCGYILVYSLVYTEWKSITHSGEAGKEKEERRV